MNSSNTTIKNLINNKGIYLNNKHYQLESPSDILFNRNGWYFNWIDAGKLIVLLIALFVCLLTVCGNVLVLLSFKLNRKLRTTTNYFLISLATADLIIGLLLMPITTTYFVTEKWLFGPYICNIWLCLDYTVSNASVANLLLISFDR
jgi:hypothetical protein